MRRDKEYFLFEVRVKIDKNVNTQYSYKSYNYGLLKPVLNKIVFSDGNETITIKDRKIYLEDTAEKELLLLYVENSSSNLKERIDYLLDEDFEITELDISIKDKNNNELKCEIIEKEQVSGKDLYEEYEYGFLDKQFKKKTACFVGLKPNELFGYDITNPKYNLVTDEIEKEVRRLIEKDNITTFITTGALGYNTLAFFEVEKLKKEYPNIRNVLAIPFQKHFMKWKDVDKKRYNEILNLADYIIETDKVDEYSIDLVANGEYHELKYHKNNTFIVNFSKRVIALWNGEMSSTTIAINYAESTGCIIDELEVEFINC